MSLIVLKKKRSGFANCILGISTLGPRDRGWNPRTDLCGASYYPCLLYPAGKVDSLLVEILTTSTITDTGKMYSPSVENLLWTSYWFPSSYRQESLHVAECCLMPAVFSLVMAASPASSSRCRQWDSSEISWSVRMYKRPIWVALAVVLDCDCILTLHTWDLAGVQSGFFVLHSDLTQPSLWEISYWKCFSCLHSMLLFRHYTFF